MFFAGVTDYGETSSHTEIINSYDLNENRDIVLKVDVTNSQEWEVPELLAKAIRERFAEYGMDEWGEVCGHFVDGVFTPYEDDEDEDQFLCFYDHVVDDTATMYFYNDWQEDEVEYLERVKIVSGAPTEELLNSQTVFVGVTVNGQVIQVGDPDELEGESAVYNYEQRNSYASATYYFNLYIGRGHTIISGDNQDYVIGSGSDLEFHSTGDYDGEFAGFTVDGEEAEGESRAGSIIVALKSSYLDTLSVGEHTLRILFDDDDELEFKFTVSNPVKNPATFDEVYGLFAVFATCMLVAVASFMRRSHCSRR